MFKITFFQLPLQQLEVFRCKASKGRTEEKRLKFLEVENVDREKYFSFSYNTGPLKETQCWRIPCRQRKYLIHPELTVVKVWNLLYLFIYVFIMYVLNLYTTLHS